MNADEIADVLESIAQLLELQGENPFKIRAYTNAARALPGAALSADELKDPERLEEIDGIGKAIAEKISTLAATGTLPFYENLKESFPPEIFQLFDLQGLGAKKIKALYEKLNIRSLTSLERACNDGSVAGLAGFGPKTAQNLLRAIEDHRRHAGSFSIATASEVAESILERLRSHPDVGQVEVAGSYRRRKETVRDLDFLASSSAPQGIIELFLDHPDAETILARGPTKASMLLRSGLQCDLRVVSRLEFPFALNYFTGSKEHNVAMRNRALSRGWSLNEYRFSIAEGKKGTPAPLPEVDDEAGIYQALGLDFIPPELREDRGEFTAAENHELPDLIRIENLRGTFHCHTTESDGRNTLEEMSLAAQELGLQYLGISDHSKSSFQANGLDEKRLAAQGEKIASLNRALEGFRIFHGVECDILKDGTLDYSDDGLASLDFVIASVHNSLTQSESEMTDRIVRAMSNPYVTMLGHVTGRLLLTREPYKVHIPTIIDAAAATGTIIELNANPRRLELDWRWWPLAVEKGVKCSINPDAHSVAGLQHLHFGIGAARKGWLTKKDVVNCLPLGKIEGVLQAKRVAQRRNGAADTFS